MPEPEQPLNEFLNRLYVGAVNESKGLAFLDKVGRMLWDGSAPGWDKGKVLADALQNIGLNQQVLLSTTPWELAEDMLDENAQAMLAYGHWGVPLIVFEGEPFYGQDRFDQLIWRINEG